MKKYDFSSFYEEISLFLYIHFYDEKFLALIIFFRITNWEKIPNVLSILGGPEFPGGTGARRIENTFKNKTYDKCYKYLIERPAVDYFTYSDGEVAVVELLRKFIESNLSVELMKDKNCRNKFGDYAIESDNNILAIRQIFFLTYWYLNY